MTDEAFNNLKWEDINVSQINEELEGYTVMGAEAIADWAKPNGEPATDGLILYLQAEGSKLTKVICIDTSTYLFGGEEESVDPIQISVAQTGEKYVKQNN